MKLLEVHVAGMQSLETHGPSAQWGTRCLAPGSHTAQPSLIA